MQKKINHALQILLLCLCWNILQGQNGFKFHKVQPGETVFSISKTYGISPEEFYKYNPETRQSLKAGDVVMVPAASAGNETPADTQRFHIHIVKDGQTLYSISKEYDVPIDLIEVNNPQIQNQTIKVGMRLLIPKNPKRAPIIADETRDPHLLQVPSEFHRVEPGESLYSIARQYKISISELMSLNQLNDSIVRVGQLIRIKDTPPSTNDKHTKPIASDDKKDSVRYTMHRVENGETLTSISKKYNISIADIKRYNPELEQMNLKSGMLLLIPIFVSPPESSTDSISDPKPGEVLEVSTIEAVNYFGMLGKRKIKVLLILPVNPDNATRELQSSDIISMDYYLGVRTALEYLQDEGYQIFLKIIEAPENSANLSLVAPNTSEFDIVIGPFVPRHIEKFNQNLPPGTKVPIVLPFGTPTSTTSGNIMLQESEEQEMRALAKAVLSNYPDVPVYLVYSDKDPKANQLNEKLKKHLNGSKIREIRLGSGLQGLSEITESKEPIAIAFFIDDNFLSSQFVERIRKSGHNSTVLLFNRRIIDNPLLEPRYLNQVNFLITAPRYIHLEHPLVQAAAQNISSVYKLEPNDIILHAFQSTYELIKTLTDNRYIPEFLDLRSTTKQGVFINARVVILTNRNYKLTPLTVQQKD